MGADDSYTELWTCLRKGERICWKKKKWTVQLDDLFNGTFKNCDVRQTNEKQNKKQTGNLCKTVITSYLFHGNIQLLNLFSLHLICFHGHYIMLTGDTSTLFHKDRNACNTFWSKIKVITHLHYRNCAPYTPILRQTCSESNTEPCLSCLGYKLQIHSQVQFK